MAEGNAMGKSDAKFADMGAAMTANLYAKAKFDAGEVPPYFMLHKDTIRTFLHEKMELLGAEGRLLGLWGIELALIAALLTSTFKDFGGIKVFSIIRGWMILRDTISWWKNRAKCSVDDLADELGRRGAVIRHDAPERE
jgi:hypothetical protein